MTHHYTILFGGTVLTMDGAHGAADAAAGPGSPTPGGPTPDAAGLRTTAIAYAAGRILGVGSDESILALAGPESQRFDLRGTVIVPGFHDPHAHPLMEGLQAGWLDLTRTADVRAALRMLSDRSVRLDFDDWLQGRFDEVRWPERRPPTRAELDRAVPDRPVLLLHRSGRLAVANSMALAMAGITAASEDRPGSAELARDEDGDPTGEIRGVDPLTPFAAALPAFSAEAARAALVEASRRLAEAGVTSVAEADLGLVAAPVDELAAYAGAALDEAFAQRLWLLPGLARLARADEDPPTPDDLRGLVPPEARERIAVEVGALHDGAPVELRERIVRAHRAGWRLAVEARSDAAAEVVLDAYAAALAERPRADHRHRIDSPIELAPELLARIRDLGVVCVVRPPAADPIESGVSTAFASYRPAWPGGPLDGIRAAVLGGWPGEGPEPGLDRRRRGISPAEALRAWTAGGAFVDRDEGESGCLAPGFRADLAILSTDPTASPVAAWRRRDHDLRVVATVIGGRPVFNELGLPDPGPNAAGDHTGDHT